MARSGFKTGDDLANAVDINLTNHAYWNLKGEGSKGQVVLRGDTMTVGAEEKGPGRCRRY